MFEAGKGREKPRSTSMPQKYVRPYSKGQKNDFRDAEAIASPPSREDSFHHHEDDGGLTISA